MKYSEIPLHPTLHRALEKIGYEEPTPIQEQAIPLVLAGNDLLGCAQTGTGKTAAFSLPMLHLLNDRIPTSKKGPREILGLIVTPTRELAIQIGESFDAYGQFGHLRHTVIFGGVNQNPQTRALKNGVDVIIATPGRLIDLMNQGYIDLGYLEIFVLDEADRMLDMGFIHDVKRIIAKLPAERQSLFFSATMPASIVKLSRTILKDPKKVEVTPASSTAETVSQEVYLVNKRDKRKLLQHVLTERDIEMALVFTRTKHGANRVAKQLSKAGIKAEAIHGNKSQNARQKALSSFKAKTTRVLVATDIAARGIDIDELSHVINFDTPNVPETYVHRIGRTGRAGASGKAITFVDTEERAYLKDIQKLIKQQVPVVEEHPYPGDGLPTPPPEPRGPRQPREGRNNGRNGGRQSQKRQSNGEGRGSGKSKAAANENGESRNNSPRTEGDQQESRGNGRNKRRRGGRGRRKGNGENTDNRNNQSAKATTNTTPRPTDTGEEKPPRKDKRRSNNNRKKGGKRGPVTSDTIIAKKGGLSDFCRLLD